MKTNKVLVIIDMQNDFIDGIFGSEEARTAAENSLDVINNWDGDVIVTLDWHNTNYEEEDPKPEVNLYPAHCIEGTWGEEINDNILDAICACKNKIKLFNKNTFGKYNMGEEWCKYNHVPDYIKIIGLCTDICVISNALILRAFFPTIPIEVDASCCAGSSPEMHEAALKVMKNCGIIITNWEE